MQDIKLAAEKIKQGEVVIFPTETVYGIGADATNSVACQNIYRLKGRPSNNPLISHVANMEDALELGEFSEGAQKLARELWPGPLTIVVQRSPSAPISSAVTANLDTIALRVPAHDLARELIQQAGTPIAAPSANPSGYISPTKFQHVQQHFDNLDKVTLLQGEDSKIGLESTIVDMSSGTPKILRHGFISAELVSQITGLECQEYNGGKLLAPGMMSKHYSPNSKIRLNATSLNQNEIGLGFGQYNFTLNLSKESDPVEAAKNLFAMLRELDHIAAKEGKSIAVAPIPQEGVGKAVNDRLLRASA